MSIYWVHAPSDNALDAMAAVEQALASGDTGLAPTTAEPAPEPLDVSGGDSYLAESIALLHATWPVDQGRIVESSRPYLGWALNRFQGLVRKATWWYALPQWLQAEQFHGATVRTLDSILEHQRQLRARVAALESPHTVDRMQGLEEQLRALRAEHQELLRKIDALAAAERER